jgi:hypothetical protein
VERHLGAPPLAALLMVPLAAQPKELGQLIGGQAGDVGRAWLCSIADLSAHLAHLVEPLLELALARLNIHLFGLMFAHVRLER